MPAQRSLCGGWNHYKSKGDLSIDIKKVECNSKKVVANSLFIAIKGYDFDGHEYVEEAIENGAVAVVLDMSADLKKIKIPKTGVTIIIIDDSRKALAKISCNYFGNPSKYFKLIGVTGTKGKTTTTYMIKSIKGNTMNFISEHQAVDLIHAIPTLVIMLITVALLFSNKIKIRLQDLFMLLGMTILALISYKQFPIFLILASKLI